MSARKLIEKMTGVCAVPRFSPHIVYRGALPGQAHGRHTSTVWGRRVCVSLEAELLVKGDGSSRLSSFHVPGGKWCAYCVSSFQTEGPVFCVRVTRVQSTTFHPQLPSTLSVSSNLDSHTATSTISLSFILCFWRNFYFGKRPGSVHWLYMRTGVCHHP